MLVEKRITFSCVVFTTLSGCGYSSTLWQGADTVPEGKVNLTPALIVQSQTEYDSRKFVLSADFP